MVFRRWCCEDLGHRVESRGEVLVFRFFGGGGEGAESCGGGGVGVTWGVKVWEMGLVWVLLILRGLVIMMLMLLSLEILILLWRRIPRAQRLLHKLPIRSPLPPSIIRTQYDDDNQHRQYRRTHPNRNLRGRRHPTFRRFRNRLRDNYRLYRLWRFRWLVCWQTQLYLHRFSQLGELVGDVALLGGGVDDVVGGLAGVTVAEVFEDFGVGADAVSYGLEKVLVVER